METQDGRSSGLVRSTDCIPQYQKKSKRKHGLPTKYYQNARCYIPNLGQYIKPGAFYRITRRCDSTKGDDGPTHLGMVPYPPTEPGVTICLWGGHFYLCNLAGQIPDCTTSRHPHPTQHHSLMYMAMSHQCPLYCRFAQIRLRGDVTALTECIVFLQPGLSVRHNSHQDNMNLQLLAFTSELNRYSHVTTRAQ
jgi:hypothetical protein